MIYAAKPPNIWVLTNTKNIGFRLDFCRLPNETQDKFRRVPKTYIDHTYFLE